MSEVQENDVQFDSPEVAKKWLESRCLNPNSRTRIDLRPDQDDPINRKFVETANRALDVIHGG